MSVICSNIVKWSKNSISNSLIKMSFIICTQFKFQSCIWLIDGTRTDTTPLGQSGPGSNGNEGVFHIPQSIRTAASLSDCLVSYAGV